LATAWMWQLFQRSCSGPDGVGPLHLLLS
jgi:hypothetical protein